MILSAPSIPKFMFDIDISLISGELKYISRLRSSVLVFTPDDFNHQDRETAVCKSAC